MVNRISRKMGWLIFIIAACIVEGFFAWQSFGGTHPFPLNEFGFQIFDHVLRDSVLAEIAYVLYYRRKRVPDRLQRYFPGRSLFHGKPA